VGWGGVWVWSEKGLVARVSVGAVYGASLVNIVNSLGERVKG
jgi:hypothetical protein